MSMVEANVPTAEKAVVEAPQHHVVKEKSVVSTPHPGAPTPLEKLDDSKAPPPPPLLADSTLSLSLILVWKYTHAHTCDGPRKDRNLFGSEKKF